MAPIELPKTTDFIRYIKREPIRSCYSLLLPGIILFLRRLMQLFQRLWRVMSLLLKHSAQTPLVSERFDQAFKNASFA